MKVEFTLGSLEPPKNENSKVNLMRTWLDHDIICLISDGVHFVLHGDCGSCSFYSVPSHLAGHILLFQVSFHLLLTVSTRTS